MSTPDATRGTGPWARFRHAIDASRPSLLASRLVQALRPAVGGSALWQGIPGSPAGRSLPTDYLPTFHAHGDDS